MDDALDDEELAMPGLTPTILLIVGFLVLVVVLRAVSRRARPMPRHDVETDDEPGER